MSEQEPHLKQLRHLRTLEKQLGHPDNVAALTVAIAALEPGSPAITRTGPGVHPGRKEGAMTEQEQHLEALITELERDPETDEEVTAVTVLLAAICALPALKALRKRTQWMGNLLAVIHCDGGHYISKHGWQKACEDAEATVLKLRKGRAAENEGVRTKSHRNIEGYLLAEYNSLMQRITDLENEETPQ